MSLWFSWLPLISEQIVNLPMVPLKVEIFGNR